MPNDLEYIKFSDDIRMIVLCILALLLAFNIYELFSYKGKKQERIKKALLHFISEEQIENNLEIISKGNLEKLFILCSKQEIERMFETLEILTNEEEKEIFLKKLLKKKEKEKEDKINKMVNEI